MSESSRSNNIFAEVASKAPIKDVIAAELGANKIIKKGSGYVCLCPFHEDHTPSMQINVQRNSFKCFVDGNGGDPIHFVELYEHLSPIEALKRVCQICSIPLPESLRDRHTFVPSIEREHPEELKALKTLEEFYQLSLKSALGKPGQEYLASRGIPEDVISHFGLGFAPDDKTAAISSLRKNGFEVSTLEKAGILTNSSELSDRYSHRLMFPIEDNYGHIVGFSGRKINPNQDGGKYINYPETDLFKKNQILYHFYKAKDTCKRDGYIYLVEGFMDVIAFVRAGINSVAGTMGTALTEEHLRAIKALGVEVRLCLDSDEPGQEGEERCLPLLLKAEIPFRVVRLFKGGKDADEVLTRNGEKGKEVLKEQANRLYDPFLFLLGRALKAGGNREKLTDPLAIQTFLRKAAPYYMALDEISKARDLSILAKVTELEEEVLSKSLADKETKLQQEEPKEENLQGRNRYPRKDGERPYYRNRDNNNRYQGYNSNRGYPYYDNRNYETQIDYGAQAIFSSKIFNAVSIINGLYQLAKDSPEGEGFYPYLLENETNLIISVLASRDAYLQFEGTKTDYAYSPYYALNNLISLIYAKDISKKSLTLSDLRSIEDSLDAMHSHPFENKEEKPQEESKHSEEKKEDDNEDFDEFFDDLDEEDKPVVSTIGDDDYTLLKKALPLFASLPSTYDPTSFKRDLTLHTYYCQLDHLIHESKRSEGEKESLETRRKRIILEKNIMNNGGKIASR